MTANYEFIDDITVPDDMELETGTPFVKTWRLKNNGTVAWGTGYKLEFADGLAMTNETSQDLPSCTPGSTVDISVELTAPNDPGFYRSDWYLKDPKGNVIGQYPVYAQIVCKAPGQIVPQPNAAAVANITIPHDTVVPLGQSFDKTWRVRNTGNVAWGVGYKLTQVDGAKMTNTTEIDLPPTIVGDTADITMPFTAPARAITAYSDFRFKDPQGNLFGNIIFVRINAKDIGTSGILDATAVSDVTIPDDTKMQPGTKFTKTWLVRNTGTQAWGDGFTLRPIKGNAMTNQTSVPVPAAQPGQEVQLSVEMVAPTQGGMHYGDWKIHDPDGNPFGDIMWTRIIVFGAAQVQVSVTTSGGSNSGTATLTVSTGTAPQVTASSGSATLTVTSSMPSASAPANPYANIQLQAAAPFFSQRDPRWANNRLGNSSSQTIGTWGCQMTCNAMFAAFKGNDIDPGRMNSIMWNQRIYVQGFYTPWNAAAQVFPNVNFVRFINYDQRTQQITQLIDQHLAQGLPVLVNVDNNPRTAYNTGEQHWVLVVHRNGDDYLMNDPAEMEPGVTSLMQRYGYSGGQLWQAVQRAIFFS